MPYGRAVNCPPRPVAARPVSGRSTCPRTSRTIRTTYTACASPPADRGRSAGRGGSRLDGDACQGSGWGLPCGLIPANASQATGQVLARKQFNDAGTLCARVPRGRYVLVVRLAKPWARNLPLHWWNRTYPLDLRGGDASYVMTNPPKNDEFQAMISGRNGWHRLWPVHRVR